MPSAAVISHTQRNLLLVYFVALFAIHNLVIDIVLIATFPLRL